MIMLKSTVIIVISVLATFVSTEKKCKCGEAPLLKKATRDLNQIKSENHPWLVKVGAYGQGSIRERWNCDGLVISPRHIITSLECGCREGFKHTMFHGGDIFVGSYPGKWKEDGESVPMENFKCLDVKDYALIELSEKISVQPICLTNDEVFDKNNEKAYKIFFRNKYYEGLGRRRNPIDAPMQTKVINPSDIEFQPDLHITKTPDSGSFSTPEPLVTVNENGRWSLRGLRLLSPEWNTKYDVHHNIAADKEILIKSSQEFCFV